MNQSKPGTASRVLLTADLHIGRSSSRLPDTVRREDVRAATAWLRIVELAIQEQVDIVCLGGDVADQDNKFWEAIGPLQQGIARLSEAQIRTVAVSGNHDYDVLGRLADQFPREQFTLLGRGGAWERTTLTKNGKDVLCIDGWSFPRQRVNDSPLNSYDLPPDSNTPILGVVHGNLYAADSPYAPLQLTRLLELPAAGWLLGHIHVPRRVTKGERPWVIYAGSPQALDPGESGLHGPWIVDVNGSELGEPEQWPLSSVWYDKCEIDLDGVATETELESVLLGGIREHTARIAQCTGPHLAHVSLRLRLAGSTAVSHRLQELARQIVADLVLPVANASLNVETIEIDTTPPIDLKQYAKTHSAPGVLARLLLELEQTEQIDKVNMLLHRVRPMLDQIIRHKDFTQLEPQEVSDELARCYLKRQARALLTQLVSQST